MSGRAREGKGSGGALPYTLRSASDTGCIPGLSSCSSSNIFRRATTSAFRTKRRKKKVSVNYYIISGGLQENVKERGIRVVQCGRSGDVVCYSVGQAGQGVQGRTLVPSVGTAMGTAATTTGESTAVRAYICQLLFLQKTAEAIYKVGRVIEK